MRKLSLCFCFFIFCAISNGYAEPSAIEEANLRAISFIDVDRGWVSGEHGAILHTQDGGLNWKSQPSPSTTCLVDIAMYNSQRGLAIGGKNEPYTGVSVGEVVITKDGGQSWSLVEGHGLPRLRKMILGLGGKCIAVGDWSPVHLTSLYASSDGGATWQPEPCDVVGSIHDIAGHVDDYLILSELGEVIRFRSNQAPQILFPSVQTEQSAVEPNNEVWQDIAARDDRRILAGPQGMIVSHDRGKTWQAIPQTVNSPLSIDATQQSSIEVWQDETWATTDSTSVITLHRPNSTQPIQHQGGSSVRAMLRLDRDRGWAVGDFGLIMATRDGGQTWRNLRAGNRSPAVMVVGSNPVEMPWSILAIESLQHQRRVALTIAKSVSEKIREQLVEATELLGPATVYCTAEDETQIAQLLHVAKPAVLVLDQSLSSSQRAAWLVASLDFGCKRVIEVGSHGTQSININAAIPAAGILSSDVWQDAIARLSPGFSPPARLMLTTRFDASGNSADSDGLAGCVHFSNQYNWSRSTTPSRRQLQVLQARTAELNWVESLLAPSITVADYKSQLDMMLPRMNKVDRTRLFSKLLTLCSQRERSDLYFASLESVENQALDLSESSKDATSFSNLAKLRLTAIRSSVEWRRVLGADAFPVGKRVSEVSSAPASSNVDLAVQWTPFHSPSTNQRGTVVTAGAVATNENNFGVASRDIRIAGGINGDGGNSASANPRLDKSAAVDLRWEFHPAVLMVTRMKEQQENMLLALSEPTAIGSHSSSTNLLRIAGLATAGAWGVLANEMIAQKTIYCPVAATPPHLDGKFDEPWWRSSRSFTTDNGMASLQLAHDNEFVYIGLDAPLLPPTKVTSKERVRDTALDHSARYRIRLDLDRDLMTAYEFEFDRNGNTRDRCDGFSDFNPRWFIACVETEGRMRVEIAIRKADMAADVAARRTIWNVSLDHFDQANPNPGLSLPEAERWLPVFLE